MSILICFVLGVIITVAEPDLTVLAHQVPSISNMTLILCVSLGAGLATVNGDKHSTENSILNLMNSFGEKFESHSAYGGILMVNKAFCHKQAYSSDTEP